MEIKRELRSFLAEEDGVGVIEVVLILVGNYITNKLRVSCVCCR
ncbi:hypothetical protein [Enterocloster asparagiformis]|nr:hypothetical protein [Enterocloster asparagiformis]